MTRNTIAEFEDEYGWLIKAWTVLYQNVIYLTCSVQDPQNLTGFVRDSDTLSGNIRGNK